MRRFLIIAFLAIVCSQLCGQNITKLRTTHFCYQVKYDTYWADWSKWEETSVLVVINTEKLRITIYSDETQQYDIIDAFDPRYDDDNNYISEFRAIDQDGMRCGIRFKENYNSNEEHLLIDYDDIKLAYVIIGI